MDAYTSPRTRPLYRGTQIVWYLVTLLQILLTFRFFFKMFAANPGAPFTAFIYSITYPFVAPFFNVFPVIYVEGAILEWANVLAMAIYWVTAWAIIRMFLISKPVSTPEAAVKLERQES